MFQVMIVAKVSTGSHLAVTSQLAQCDTREQADARSLASQRAPALFARLLLISSAASFCATSSASAADTFTSGSMPVPSQSVFVIGLMERPVGTMTEK
jgi:hypothetical protein